MIEVLLGFGVVAVSGFLFMCFFWAAGAGAEEDAERWSDA